MIRRFFRLDELGTTPAREGVAGLTTFMTMAYIIVVNPKILEAAGIPFGPSMVATVLTACLGSLLMGLYANRPFAIAPYMGENAFIAYVVVKVLGADWQTALGAVFLGGLAFFLVTVLRLRVWLVRAVPESLKIGFSAGIGLFLAFIGLNETGIVALGVSGAPVRVGNWHDPNVLLAMSGFLLIGVLMIRRVPGAILVGISAVALAAFGLGVAPLPRQWVSLPPSPVPVMFRLDLAGALTWKMFPVILTVFVMDFVDTMGTLIGVSYKAGLLDRNGELPEIEKPMLCDALSTMGAAALGTSTAGAYIESATGIAAGGRSGLTAVVVGLLFMLALFFSDFFGAIPSCAYGPALIVVGMLMLAPIRNLPFDDLTESMPVFCLLALMSFTCNIGVGMTAGFLVHPLVKTAAGKGREVPAGMWVLAGISLLFFVFYPY